MLARVKRYVDLCRNMGSRYVLYRAKLEVDKRTGRLTSRYPTDPAPVRHIGLAEWRQTAAPFFFDARESLTLPKRPQPALRTQIERMRRGEFPYFNAGYLDIGANYDWLTNPDSGYRYDPAQHWLQINDYARETGDIKYVWEKARFSFLYPIIRHDYHHGEDCAEWVFSEIDSWIDANPINCGPNFKCSQEISLRTLNWLFALYYYKHAPALTEARFQRILHVCYWQLHHVYENIDFSRIAVRNNHAITETMMLYLGGIFFPFFPQAAAWSAAGRKWLEEEVAYQVYADGTFLQFSHNYHRVLIQLMTWSLYLSARNGCPLSAEFQEKCKRSLFYLYSCQLADSGELPNYGANDGALFFPLNNCAYRDYRPQLNALYYYFSGRDLYPEGDWTEDRHWYAATPVRAADPAFRLDPQPSGRMDFPTGGYYLYREVDTLLFIRCGNHADRPSHADNLHLDLWYEGVNMLRDAGTYKYNTDPETLSYFIGTKGHNTVQLGHVDQMHKGNRFIWYNWTQALRAEARLDEDAYVFEGCISAFRAVDKTARHCRRVRQAKGEAAWEIRDTVTHRTTLPMRQIWNIHPDFLRQFEITARDQAGQELRAVAEDRWYSSEYGMREAATALVFETSGKAITTTISKL